MNTEVNWLDVSNNNDEKLVTRILNTQGGDRIGHLYNGMFVNYISKFDKMSLKQFYEIKDDFINRTYALLSGNEDIEPELSELEYTNIERLRKMNYEEFNFTKGNRL